MIFLVYKRRETADRGLVPKLIGAVSANTITEASEKLDLKFSMPESIIVGLQIESHVAYKKTKRHKTQFFLREVRELQMNDL